MIGLYHFLPLYDKKKSIILHILSISNEKFPKNYFGKSLKGGKGQMNFTKIVETKWNKSVAECSNEEIYIALLEMTKELAHEKEKNALLEKKVLDLKERIIDLV